MSGGPRLISHTSTTKEKNTATELSTKKTFLWRIGGYLKYQKTNDWDLQTHGRLIYFNSSSPSLSLGYTIEEGFHYQKYTIKNMVVPGLFLGYESLPYLSASYPDGETINATSLNQFYSGLSLSSNLFLRPTLNLGLNQHDGTLIRHATQYDHQLFGVGLSLESSRNKIGRNVVRDNHLELSMIIEKF